MSEEEKTSPQHISKSSEAMKPENLKILFASIPEGMRKQYEERLAAAEKDKTREERNVPGPVRASTPIPELQTPVDLGDTEAWKRIIDDPDNEIVEFYPSATGLESPPGGLSEIRPGRAKSLGESNSFPSHTWAHNLDGDRVAPSLVLGDIKLASTIRSTRPAWAQFAEQYDDSDPQEKGPDDSIARLLRDMCRTLADQNLELHRQRRIIDQQEATIKTMQRNLEGMLKPDRGLVPEHRPTSRVLSIPSAPSIGDVESLSRHSLADDLSDVW